MRMRSVVVAAVLAVGLLATGCSGGGGSSSKPAAAAPGKTTTTTVKVNATVLPPNTPKSEQFCALTASLAEKFKGAAKPNGPAELVPYLRALIGFFQQSQAVAPAVLVPDIQKLNQFYGPLADQIESGKATTASTRARLGDLALSSNRLREYFSKICGVDDTVFNL